MTCRDYQQQISLFLYEELPDPDKPAFVTHIEACETCKLAFEEEKGLQSVMSEDAAAWDVPSDLLVESRRELANELDRLENKRSWWRIPTFSVVFTPMRLLESAALVAMGLALGVYLTNQQAARLATSVPAMAQSPITAAIPANGSVSNLRIVSANPSTGQVELAGEIVQPLRVEGAMSDDTVRQLVVSALGDTSNSGSRLRALEILTPRANEQLIKSALIQTLMYDEKPLVRLRALQALKQFAAQPDVREAFMYSLSNDRDAGIRIETIEALTARNTSDAALAKALEPFTRDENQYVKMQALQFVGNNK